METIGYVKNSKLMEKYRLKRLNNPTRSETMLYEYLKKSKYTIDKEVIIGDFIVDMAIKSKLVVIEVDGGVHYNKIKWADDILRDGWMSEKRFKVFRVSNSDVGQRLSEIGDRIISYCDSVKGKSHREFDAILQVILREKKNKWG